MSLINFIRYGFRAPDLPSFDNSNRSYNVSLIPSSSEEDKANATSYTQKPLSKRVSKEPSTNSWIVDKIFRVTVSSERVEQTHKALDCWNRLNGNIEITLKASLGLSLGIAFILPAFGAFRNPEVRVTKRSLQIAIALNVIMAVSASFGGWCLGRHRLSKSKLAELRGWMSNPGKRMACDRAEALQKSFAGIYRENLKDLLTQEEVVKSYEDLFALYARKFLEEKNKLEEVWLDSFLNHDAHPFDGKVMSFVYGMDIPMQKRLVSQTFSGLRINSQQKSDASLEIQKLIEQLSMMVDPTNDLLI